MLQQRKKTPIMGRPLVRPPLPPPPPPPKIDQREGELPPPKVWGKPTWDVIWNAVKKLEFLEKNDPPAEILQQEKHRLHLWFQGLPSALPCWNCTQHTLELYEKRAPDVSSGKALREWVGWLQDEVNAHTKAQKEAAAAKEPSVPFIYMRQWVPKTCSSC